MARPQSATGAGLINRATRLPLYRGHKKPDIPARSVGFFTSAKICIWMHHPMPHQRLSGFLAEWVNDIGALIKLLPGAGADPIDHQNGDHAEIDKDPEQSGGIERL